jgi:pantoate--beta-alanine ligase
MLLNILSLHPLRKLVVQLFESINELQPVLFSLKSKGFTVGFVPTMGALHKGHLSLVEQAAKENNVVVMSIFVNPTQFNNTEDLEKYPRTLASDVKLLQTLVVSENLLVYAPKASDIYNEQITSEKFDFNGLENEMEGKFREGHFDGVGTVVKRLFKMISPHKAYFGEKDFQQLQIVKSMTQKEKLPVEIIGCPILREPSGLAMSSRNQRLTDEQLTAAPLIYKVLQNAKKTFSEKPIATIEDDVKKAFENNPHLTLEYFQIADEKTLKPAFEKDTNTKYRAFIAVYAGDIRLIDNIALN